MGVRLFHVNLADSSVSEGGATIAEITRVIEELSPDTIYAPSAHDLNPDHRNVHHATMVAARRVPRVFCYQTPSSTVEFRPTRFVPVDEFMDRKLAVIRSYTSQVKQRRYLDAELLRATSRYWSRYGHSRFVEPFEVARDTESDGALETGSESNVSELLEASDQLASS
jgi:LmbE family N-acetylglucosaminyl deacetylase